MAWYARVKDQNDSLNNALRDINQTISKYNQEASAFKNEFTKNGVT
jgi:uncharacterized coiled-coil DUF342 family protein